MWLFFIYLIFSECVDIWLTLFLLLLQTSSFPDASPSPTKLLSEHPLSAFVKDEEEPAPSCALLVKQEVEQEVAVALKEEEVQVKVEAGTETAASWNHAASFSCPLLLAARSPSPYFVRKRYFYNWLRQGPQNAIHLNTFLYLESACKIQVFCVLMDEWMNTENVPCKKLYTEEKMSYLIYK